MQLKLISTPIPKEVIDSFHRYISDQSHKNLKDLLDLVRLQSNEVIMAYKIYVNNYIRDNNFRSHK